MTVLLVILYVLVCLFLVMVVLLQQGKGADLAGAFGGGGSQTSFGPRTRTNIMHRLTTVSFVLFVVLSITLAIVSGKRSGSVMEDVATVPQAPTTAGETLAAEPAIDEEAARPGPAAVDPAPDAAPETTD